MDREVMQALADGAARFARDEVAPMVGREGRDGDLGRLAQVLGRAAEAGLYPGQADPVGVWSAVGTDQDARPALEVLRALGSECAGVAACVHAASLGSCIASGSRPIAIAFFEEWPLSWQALDEPPPGSCLIGEGMLLSGSKSFVAVPPGTEAFLVYAAREGCWRRLLLPRDARGCRAIDMGPRTGLAALPMASLVFAAVPIALDMMLPDVDPAEALWKDLLGLCAVALGNAEGALESARAYAASRYQGGGPIQGHEAVMALLGDAASRIEACRGQLWDVAADASARPRRRLWRSIAAKLRITSAAEHAVSDALQVLGGYGYMEDYRLEKRLRDAMTLRLMAVKPEVARRLCASPRP